MRGRRPARLSPAHASRGSHQGDKSDGSGSLGLGLYIASEIAKAHHGTLHVRSGETETAFVLRLPRSGEQGRCRTRAPMS
ncbi:sensor histidine kinase [Paraburkholderia youngii]|uniref:sensor histidine kinase n=1 Tax=Paraburkholderia youngii TaxID=2782701 RepID=UPI003D19DC48